MAVQREFVSHGLRMYTRAEWTAFVSAHAQQLDSVYDLIFNRHGVHRAGLHGGGEIAGVPALRVRGMSVDLSVRRYVQVIVLLGALGLGMISGVRQRGRGEPPACVMHDWRVFVRRQYPASLRRDVVFFALAPLLPLSRRLYEQHWEDMVQSLDGAD